MGAFFQELTPEIKVTVDENSERHFMTTTYIPKLWHIILGILLQGSHRPGKIDPGPGKLQEFEKSAFCPGIVLEFCKIILENMNSSLKNIKIQQVL